MNEISEHAQLLLDLSEALNLLQVAGPNPMIIDSDEYWERHAKLMNKYMPDEDESHD